MQTLAAPTRHYHSTDHVERVVEICSIVARVRVAIGKDEVVEQNRHRRCTRTCVHVYVCILKIVVCIHPTKVTQLEREGRCSCRVERYRREHVPGTSFEAQIGNTFVSLRRCIPCTTVATTWFDPPDPTTQIALSLPLASHTAIWCCNVRTLFPP